MTTDKLKFADVMSTTCRFNSWAFHITNDSGQIVHTSVPLSQNNIQCVREKWDQNVFFVISPIKLGRFWWNLVDRFPDKFAAKSCKQFPPHPHGMPAWHPLPVVTFSCRLHRLTRIYSRCRTSYHVVSNHVDNDKLTTANGGTFTASSASRSSQSR